MRLAPDDMMTASAPAPALGAPRKPFVIPRNPLIAAAIAMLIAIAGALWLALPASSESTDNAYLQADSSSVAPKVGGLVTAILVKDNQTVRAGQPLVRIDSQDYETKMFSASAALADAQAEVATAKAELDALNAQEGLASAQVRAAGTSIASADAEYARAAADNQRFNTLLEQGFATRRDVERVNSVAIGASSARQRARADLGVADEQAAVTRARRPILQAQLARANAAVLKARAALDLTKQDLRHTVVLAPMDGVIGNRQVQKGDYVQPGSRLLTLVPQSSVYVIANFKETQTRSMRVGQKAKISVDALGGKVLTGEIESFAPGSGSEFTLLPFEPGSGNFTKIVQRIGVRIRLDPGQVSPMSLRPGLSVTARVILD